MKVLDTISPSFLNAWSTCRLQWYWSYPMGYRSIRQVEQFGLGRGVHVALENLYKYDADPVLVFQKWSKDEIRKLQTDTGAKSAVVLGVDIEVGRILDGEVVAMKNNAVLGEGMLEAYVEKYRNEDLEVLATEHTVARPIPGTDWKLLCRIDTIVRDHGRRGKIYVLEHKTFSRFDLGYLEKDHQFVAEAWCAEAVMEELDIDEPIQGVIYNGLRKKIASKRTKLPMFERHHIDIAPNQIRLLHRRCRDVYRMLQRGKLSIYPEPSPIKCSSCAFKEPCTAYMKGEDYQFILDNLYVRRDDGGVSSDES